MSVVSITCPSCFKTEAEFVGPLPELYGMIKLKTPGNLYECYSCGLFFRYPYLSHAEVSNQYKNADNDLWAYTPYRNDYAIAYSFIYQNYESGKVLDIGCHRGDFLAGLKESFNKYGIEKSKKATILARSKNIKMLNEVILDNNEYPEKFDIITLFDVIEHIVEPAPFLMKVRKLLKHKGIIIIATGNIDFFLWKMTRHNYWYYYPEHVSFISPKWVKRFCNRSDLRVVVCKKYSHGEKNLYDQVKQLLKFFTYYCVEKSRAIHKLHKVLVRAFPFSKVKDWRSAPEMLAWNDHFLVALQAQD